MKLNQLSLRARLTIGIVLLSAIGFVAIFLGTTAALKGFLVGQIDDQLKSVAGGTALRLDRGATIQRDDDDLEREGRHRRDGAMSTPQPLQRIPTTLSVTLLDPNGLIKGSLGGDLATSQIADYVVGFTNSDALAVASEPFGIEAPGSDFRALAIVLPTTGDTLIVAQSLEAVDKTQKRLLTLFFLVSGSGCSQVEQRRMQVFGSF